jgi:hypothetical protein
VNAQARTITQISANCVLNARNTSEFGSETVDKGESFTERIRECRSEEGDVTATDFLETRQRWTLPLAVCKVHLALFPMFG